MRAALLTLVLLTGASASADTLRVFAASSLTEAFTALGKAFDAKTGHRTTFQFAGSQALRTQIEQGARADVLASANAAQFQPLVKAGLVRAGRDFARNRLMVIVPRGSTRVSSLRDLATPGLKLVIADRNVPAGDYTRRMLEAVDRSGTYGRGFAARALRNVVSEEPNVRQVALKVQLGEADAAIVYATDVTPTLKNAVRTVALPSRFNQTATYPVGTLAAAASPEAANAFVEFALSPEGQRILRAWGFLAPR